MPKTEASSFDDEWKDEEDNTPDPKDTARSQLALDAMQYVNESIRDRNASTFSNEIKRAYSLYNAVSIDPAEDLLENFEGTRTAVKDGSKVVQNIVRQITNDGASQLGDMLFPVDTENWGINPLYPAKPPLDIQHEQAAGPDGEPLTQQGQDAEGTPVEEPVTHLQAWKARRVALDHRVGRMRTKIRNTLENAKFGKLGRQLIHDAAISGTAVLKGPFVDYSKSRRWSKNGEKYELGTEKNRMPGFKVVGVLDFLPEMAAEDPDSISYASVREWYLKRNLRGLKRSGKYDRKAIDRLLQRRPRYSGEGAEDTRTERLSLKDASLVEKLYENRYEVFETWGEFSVRLLREAGVRKIDEDLSDDDTLTACVIHCDGEYLKGFLNPHPSDDLPFHIWNWDRDPSSIFGKGIPILAENSQLIYNAVWRMILDHGGLSAVPMYGMVKDKVEPATGDKSDFSLRGGKGWLIKSEMFNLPDGTKGSPFEVYDIPVHLDQFFAIMEKAEEDAYKLTGVTRIDKNEPGVDNAPVTLGATQIYQNNASSARRRQVRDFDDVVTKSALTLLYDWLMAYEKDSDSKGPMEIEPKGSSVLMQREVNTQNLMQLYQITVNGSAEGAKPVEMLREIQTGMQFPDGKFIETADETAARREREAENPPIPPEISIQQEELAWTREKGEADVEINFMLAEIKKVEAFGKAEQSRIDGERLHYREMLKLEQMTEQAFNKNMADLQKAQEKLQGDLMTKMEDIRTKRDIAAGEQLTKEATTDKDAKLLTAIAKKKDADTKEKELTSKLSGQIKEGI
jgi:hypothetical protein